MVVPFAFGIVMIIIGALILRFRSQLVEFQFHELHQGKPFIRGLLYVVTHSPRPMDVRERLRQNVLLSGGSIVVAGCIMLVLTVFFKR
jgi:hypothetical protein